MDIDSRVPVPLCATFPDTENKDFITVVSVGLDGQTHPNEEENGFKGKDNDGSFVTVLTIGDDHKNDEFCEEILVYRLPGERLGFGLKFEGGTKTSECVRRLFIQSCAPNSPASRVKTSWGNLVEGDEVIKIDEHPVKTMTRIDCVRCLKDSNVVIKLLVKHHPKPNSEDIEKDLPLVIKAEKKKLSKPPPVPPRKISRKQKAPTGPPRSASEEPETGEKILENTEKLNKSVPSSPKTAIRSKELPQRLRDRRLSNEFNAPPDAEVYLDLLAEELEFDLRNESESDDTSSTISTVMDRHHGNFPEICSLSSCDSTPSTPTLRQKQLDLSKVIGPYEALEIEFETNNNQPDDCLKLNHCQDLINEIPKIIQKDPFKEVLSPANFQDAHLSYGDENVRTIIEPPEIETCIDPLKSETPLNVEELNILNKMETPPKPIPRKCYKKKNDESSNPEAILPRLVNFVPKITKEVSADDFTNHVDLIQKASMEKQQTPEEMFEIPHYENGNTYYSLDIISLDTVPNLLEYPDMCMDQNLDNLDQDDHFSYWPTSRPLTTIGEDEEIESENKIRSETVVPVIKTDEVTDSPPKSPIEMSEESLKQILEQDLKTVPETNTKFVIPETNVIPCEESSVDQQKDEVDCISLQENDHPVKAMDQPEASPRTQKPLPADDPPTEISELIHKSQIQNCETEVTPITRNIPPIPQKRNFIPKILPEENEQAKENVLQPENADKPETLAPTTTAAATTTTTPKSKTETISRPTLKPTVIQTPEKKHGSWWRKDEKSSGSVRDKIARFSTSNPKVDENKKLQKTYKSSEDILIDFLDVNMSTPTSNEKASVEKVEVPKVKSGDVFAKTRSSSSLDLTLNLDKNEPYIPMSKEVSSPRVTSPMQKTEDSSLGFTKTRSQSMCNISSQFEISSIITTMNVRNKESAESRKMALNSLIEQRRRSMSKLKGLVIPEKSVDVPDVAVVDLPEIRSTNTQLPKISKDDRKDRENNTSPTNKTYSSKSLLSPPWKDSESNLMKYSPAFKRKNLQLYGLSPQTSPTESFIQPTEAFSRPDSLSLKDTEDSLSPSVTSPVHSSFGAFNLDTPDGNSFISIQDEIISSRKAEKYENESDTDSAVGSSQSSCSKDISLSSIVSEPSRRDDFTKTLEPLEDQTSNQEDSKPSSLPEKPVEPPIEPTISTKIPPKIEDLTKESKTIESINRKNVLESSKHRNGQELNFSSIRSKFENDDHTVPIPTQKHTFFKPKKDLNLSNNNLNNSANSLESSDDDLKKKSVSDKFSPATTKRSRISVPKLKKAHTTNGSNGLLPNKVSPKTFGSRIENGESHNGGLMEPIVNGISNLKGRRRNSDSFDKINKVIEKNGGMENIKPMVNGMTSVQKESSTISQNSNLDRKDCEVVVLHREIASGSIGIILTGGIDYESKAITVHKVLIDSPAYKDGRIKKGIEILSINGKNMHGLTHKESVDILKAPCKEVTLVIAPDVMQKVPSKKQPSPDKTSMPPVTEAIESLSTPSEDKTPIQVTLVKDKAGLGFSLDGGFDSPSGNKPLVIKKIFTGGAAEKCGKLQAGDELLGVNNTNINKMTRIEVWSMMKKLPEGEVILKIRKKD